MQVILLMNAYNCALESVEFTCTSENKLPLKLFVVVKNIFFWGVQHLHNLSWKPSLGSFPKKVVYYCNMSSRFTWHTWPWLYKLAFKSHCTECPHRYFNTPLLIEASPHTFVWTVDITKIVVRAQNFWKASFWQKCAESNWSLIRT